jgi:hypothetical protein
MTNQKNVMHWGTYIYIRSYQKNHLNLKVFLGKKNLQSFSKVIPLASSYKF